MIIGHRCDDHIHIKNTYISVPNCKWLQILCSFPTDRLILFPSPWIWASIVSRFDYENETGVMLGTLTAPCDWAQASLLEGNRPPWNRNEVLIWQLIILTNSLKTARHMRTLVLHYAATSQLSSWQYMSERAQQRLAKLTQLRSWSSWPGNHQLNKKSFFSRAKVLQS